MNTDKTTRVILIGGPPKSGKTNVARRLAALIEYVCISTDDLLEAVRAVTDNRSAPDLHPMSGLDYREYFVKHTLEDLVYHYQRQHMACWPAVEAVIRKHATWGCPAVIEGWNITPERVKAMTVPNVAAVWLLPTPEVLDRNTRVRDSFYLGASNEELMVERYLARSLHYSAWIKASLGPNSMPFVEVRLDSSINDIVEACLQLVSGAQQSQSGHKGN